MTTELTTSTTRALPVPEAQTTYPSTRRDLLAALTALPVGALAVLDRHDVLLLRAEEAGQLGWFSSDGPYYITDGILESLIDRTAHAPAHAVRYGGGEAEAFALPDCSPTGPYVWAEPRARMWREELTRELLEDRRCPTLLTLNTADGTVAAAYGRHQFLTVHGGWRFTPDTDLDTLIPESRPGERIELWAIGGARDEDTDVAAETL